MEFDGLAFVRSLHNSVDDDDDDVSAWWRSAVDEDECDVSGRLCFFKLTCTSWFDEGEGMTCFCVYVWRASSVHLRINSFRNCFIRRGLDESFSLGRLSNEWRSIFRCRRRTFDLIETQWRLICLVTLDWDSLLFISIESLEGKNISVVIDRSIDAKFSSRKKSPPNSSNVKCPITSSLVNNK